MTRDLNTQFTSVPSCHLWLFVPSIVFIVVLVPDMTIKMWQLREGPVKKLLDISLNFSPNGTLNPAVVSGTTNNHSNHNSFSNLTQGNSSNANSSPNSLTREAELHSAPVSSSSAAVCSSSFSRRSATSARGCASSGSPSSASSLPCSSPASSSESSSLSPSFGSLSTHQSSASFSSMSSTPSPPLSASSPPSPLLLRIPRVVYCGVDCVASPRRFYSNAHAYHIHSVSVCSDAESFVSADDLRINLWKAEVADQVCARFLSACSFLAPPELGHQLSLSSFLSFFFVSFSKFCSIFFLCSDVICDLFSLIIPSCVFTFCFPWVELFGFLSFLSFLLCFLPCLSVCFLYLPVLFSIPPLHFSCLSLAQCFTLVDLKPSSMEELNEVITCACFHPSLGHILLFSTSRGTIRIADMRESAICDNTAKSIMIIMMMMMMMRDPECRRKSEISLSLIMLSNSFFFFCL